MDMFADRPMKDWVTDLAKQAQIVVAIGDCACWGGIPAMEPNPSASTGLQFHKRAKGGFLALTSDRRWAFRHQHPGLPGPPGLDHPDPRRTGDRPRRRYRPG